MEKKEQSIKKMSFWLGLETLQCTIGYFGDSYVNGTGSSSCHLLNYVKDTLHCQTDTLHCQTGDYMHRVRVNS